jgi:hypothetical protein
MITGHMLHASSFKMICGNLEAMPWFVSPRNNIFIYKLGGPSRHHTFPSAQPGYPCLPDRRALQVHPLSNLSHFGLGVYPALRGASIPGRSYLQSYPVSFHLLILLIFFIAPFTKSNKLGCQKPKQLEACGMQPVACIKSIFISQIPNRTLNLHPQN